MIKSPLSLWPTYLLTLTKPVLTMWFPYLFKVSPENYILRVIVFFYSLLNNMLSNICLTWPAPSSYLTFQIKFQRNMPCLQYLKLQSPFTTFLIIHCSIFLYVLFFNLCPISEFKLQRHRLWYSLFITSVFYN